MWKNTIFFCKTPDLTQMLSERILFTHQNVDLKTESIKMSLILLNKNASFHVLDHSNELMNLYKYINIILNMRFLDRLYKDLLSFTRVVNS